MPSSVKQIKIRNKVLLQVLRTKHVVSDNIRNDFRGRFFDFLIVKQYKKHVQWDEKRFIDINQTND